MISRIADYLASAIVRKTEEVQYREVYTYVLFLILNYILFFGYSLILGSLLGIPFQSIVFFLATAILRRYAGGYHADTETVCLIISALYFSSGIVFIKLISNGVIFLNIFYIVAATACSLIIIFLCPCDSPEKPLEENLRRTIKIKSIVLVIVYFALILCLWFCNMQLWASVFTVSLYIEAVLIAAGAVKYRKRNKHLCKNDTEK